MRKFLKLMIMFFILIPVLTISLAAAEEAPAKPSSEMQSGQAKPNEVKPAETKDGGTGKKAPVEKLIDKKELPPINMVFIKGGCFQMGDWTGDGDDDERPVHEVCLNDYYLQETPVTLGLFEKVMGYKHDETRDTNEALGYISWTMASEFIKRLNKITKETYRFPTEAEWEFAAREGGKNFKWAGFNNEAELGDYAWFAENSGGKMQAVKKKKPNALGLYDMSGNVWQWTEDYFDFDYYKVSPKKDPYGPNFAYWRVIRGGSYATGPHKLRTTYRYALDPMIRQMDVGFRLAQ